MSACADVFLFTTLSQNLLRSRQELREIIKLRASLSISVFFETLMHFTEVLYFDVSFLPTQKSQSCHLLSLDPRRDSRVRKEYNFLTNHDFSICSLTGCSSPTPCLRKNTFRVLRVQQFWSSYVLWALNEQCCFPKWLCSKLTGVVDHKFSLQPFLYTTAIQEVSWMCVFLDWLGFFCLWKIRRHFSFTNQLFLCNCTQLRFQIGSAYRINFFSWKDLSLYA